MKELLFLAHRIPYPPNKGDKIRSFNILRYLSRYYRVHLGAFVDDAADWDQASKLSALCAETCFVPLHPTAARLRSLPALLRAEPLTLAYYRNRRLQRWVDAVLATNAVDRVFVFCSAMAQYIDRGQGSRLRRVLDFVDVDSDKWRQYAATRPLPFSGIYAREARTLFAYERKCAAAFDASLFVSQAEARLFRRLAPETAARVGYVENGVDADFFSPAHDYPNPYAVDEQPLVFTGAMDYWANVDAVTWFADEVFPNIRATIPSATFYIVGARPSRTVARLGMREGIRVTGTVKDTRPYLAHAALVVAPLRIARGVQNKVLEAMAMEQPVLLTPQAADGLQLDDGLRSLVCDDAKMLSQRAIQLLEKGGRDLRLSSRAWVLRHYDWERNLSGVLRCFEDHELPAVGAARAIS